MWFWPKHILWTVLLVAGAIATAQESATDEQDVTFRREVKSFHLYATDGYLDTADGKRLYIWGYSLENRPGSATLPGPLLEVNEGDIVKVTLSNLGPSKEGVHRVPHTVHLHGLDTNQENDGVPETASAVRVGESFTYVFEATHAGTYWYHCHVDTVEHLTMGMYGALVVHPLGGEKTAWTGGPAYQRAYTMLLSESDPAWSQAISEDRSPELTNYQPRYFFINGKSFPDTMDDPSTHVMGYLGERVLIRLINAGYEWRSMHMHGFHFEVVASDGRPLPYAYSKDTLSIGPGERYDILVTFDQPGEFPFHSHVILDNMNDGSYPGGIHTMVTVLEPEELATHGSHGEAGHAAHGHAPPGEALGEPEPAEVDETSRAEPDEIPSPKPSSSRLGFGFPGKASSPATDTEEPKSPIASSSGFEVLMAKDRFDPERLVVPTGSTVTWVNADPRTHSLASKRFVGSDVKRNERWSYTFTEPGTYVYECATHRGMDGVIVVRE